MVCDFFCVLCAVIKCEIIHHKSKLINQFRYIRTRYFTDNMASYLFQIELPEPTEDMTNRIPAHREHIEQLFADGKILSYSVSVHRNQIWCVIAADDEQEAMEIVLRFPLYEYFTDVVCHPLLFHSNMPATLPGISLN